MANMIEITKERYNELLAAEEDLHALEEAGVHNWEGYYMAIEAGERNEM